MMFDVRAGGAGTSAQLWRHFFKPKGVDCTYLNSTTSPGVAEMEVKTRLTGTIISHFTWSWGKIESGKETETACLAGDSLGSLMPSWNEHKQISMSGPYLPGFARSDFKGPGLFFICSRMLGLSKLLQKWGGIVWMAIIDCWEGSRCALFRREVKLKPCLQILSASPSEFRGD